MNIDDFPLIFPTTPGLDRDLGRIGITLGGLDKEISGSLEFCDYYANLQRPVSGDLTPISCGSEIEFNTNDATAGSSSTADFDFTLTEDIDRDDTETLDNNQTLTSATSRCLIDNCNALRSANINPKSISPFTANINLYSNDLEKLQSGKVKPVSNIKRAQSLYAKKSEAGNETIDIRHLVKDFSKFDKDASTSNSNNMTNVGCLKWSTSKEKFFDITRDCKTDNIELGKNLNTGVVKKVDKLNPGSILVKESFIDPPKISRVSRSFHGNSSSGSHLDISNVWQRASDVPLSSKSVNEVLGAENGATSKPNDGVTRRRPQFVSQLSNPYEERSIGLDNLPRKTSLAADFVVKNPRFTTIKVDEAEHAASVGLPLTKPPALDSRQGSVEEGHPARRKYSDNNASDHD